jgi:hypothetical protein
MGNSLQADATSGQIRKIAGPTKGMEITTSDGTVVRTGVDTNRPIAKPTENKIESNLLESKEAVNKVANIISGFQPKYQTLPFRAKTAWESTKQKFGLKPNPETRKQLSEFKGWYKMAMRDYAIAIQALGKGNLTKNEEQLYGAGLPDPGKGLYPKDAPEVYWNAIVDRYKGLNASIARHQHYLNSGLSTEQVYSLIKEDKVISLDDMNKVINERGKALEEEFKGKYETVQELTNAIKESLQTEFFGGK